MSEKTIVDPVVELLEEVGITTEKQIIVYNDDVNTFDHVIDTLVRACEHTMEQAEQCTWLIHYKGKCSVKKGALSILKSVKDAICEAGIDAKIV